MAEGAFLVPQCASSCNRNQRQSVLRVSQSDYPRRDVHSHQHRRGAGAEDRAGVRALPSHCVGFDVGAGVPPSRRVGYRRAWGRGARVTGCAANRSKDDAPRSPSASRERGACTQNARPTRPVVGRRWLAASSWPLAASAGSTSAPLAAGLSLGPLRRMATRRPSAEQSSKSRSPQKS
jgi:hypothetical protein